MTVSYKYSLITACLLALVFSLSACSMDYESEVLNERSEKDDWMVNDDESPLPSWDREHFDGLTYYPVDETYRVMSRIERLPVGQYYRLKMTDGTEEQYQKYGYAVFDLLGKEHRLLLLKNPRERTTLFLAFGDLTNGKGSYGGGRYLDLENNNTGRLELDFNKAYSPYCAYSGQFVCPVPPPENQMDIPIPAGEKTYGAE